jgi:hypothetical protein
MIAGVVVAAAVAFAIAFSVAYVARRDLRAWIEQPKYRFQDSVQRYDRDRIAAMNHSRGPRS